MLFGKHINKYYFIFSLYYLIGFAALIAVDFFQLEIPEIYSTIIDGLVNPSHNVVVNNQVVSLLNYLPTLMAKMFLILGVMVLGRFLWRICFFGTAIKVESRIRKEMFDHCKDLSIQYYQQNKVGNLMSLFTNDLDTINECFGDGILMLFDALGLGSLALYKMFRLNYKLTLLLLIPLGILIAMGIIVGKYMKEKWEARQEAYSELSDFTQESISGISVIKAFVKESKELMAFKKINKNNENVNVNFVKASTLLNVLVTVLVQSVLCVILGYGGYLATSGVFSVGDLIKFISYFNSCIWPMSAIAMLIDMSSRGKASYKRIAELLDKEIDVKDNKDAKDINEVKGNIEFKNLSFAYPDESTNVLNNITFTINQGENVGIIGKTGCGKTTLVDLIIRLYNVKDNTLFIDGIDVNKITIKSLRNFIAYVPQDNFLFSDSIENNIAFAYENVDEDKVIKAAKLADVHDNIVEFEQSYKTILGERGVTISGGQKQRTSIARAIMKDASILILDDSVSAVDTKTEAKILNNLAIERKGKTTILIAHRITTIEKMDKIIFMDNGNIIAIGNHEQLINTCEEYAKMVALQKLEDEQGGNE